MLVPQQDTLHAFASLLQEPTVEVSSLRRLAARGIPSHPPHLRPLTYSILLGVLGKDSANWEKERQACREKYSSFADSFLKQVEDALPPTFPLTTNDRLLDEIGKDVHRTQTHLDFFNQPIPPRAGPTSSTTSTDPSQPSPSNTSSDIPHKRALAIRLDLIASASHAPIPKPSLTFTHTDSASSHSRDNSLEAPLSSPSLSIRSNGTIRPSDNGEAAPSTPTTPTASTSSLSVSEFSTTKPTTTSLDIPAPKKKPSKPLPPPSTPSTSPDLHRDALIRILYIFTLLHPHLAYTQGFSELLGPLYFTYASQDDDLEEGDVFWSFVSLMAEVGDVVKGPGDGSWEAMRGEGDRDVKWALKRFSNRVRWADQLLWDDLKRKSLDPALPYYSFRWISTLLAQDLPMPALLRVWDAMLSEGPSTRDATPKVDFLIDICTAMILLIRKPLIDAGRHALWGEHLDEGGEFGEGFVEGMALLQKYSLKRVGIDNIIALAFESRQRRILAELDGEGPEDLDDPSPRPLVAAQPQPLASTISSARRRLFGSPSSSLPIPEQDFPDDISEVSSNHSASSPASNGNRFAAMKRYAETFKESDTAAALSKRSTNLLATWGPSRPNLQSRPSVVLEEEGKSLPLPLQTSDHSNRSTSPRPDFHETFDSDESPPNSATLPLTPNRTNPQSTSATTPSNKGTPRTLAERLAASLATPAAASLTPPSTSLSRTPSGSSPKPLLLSASARPAADFSPNYKSTFSPTPSITRPSWAESPTSARSARSSASMSNHEDDRRPSFHEPSDSESSARIPIGGGASNRRSSFVPDPIPPHRTFLKTTPKAVNSGVRLRETSAGGHGRAATSPANGLDDRFTRPVPRAARTRGAGKTESVSSAGGGSESEAGQSSRSRISTQSTESARPGWTLTDDGPVSTSSIPPASPASSISSSKIISSQSPPRRTPSVTSSTTTADVRPSNDVSSPPPSFKIPATDAPRPSVSRSQTARPSSIASNSSTPAPSIDTALESLSIRPVTGSPTKPVASPLPYTSAPPSTYTRPFPRHSRTESSASTDSVSSAIRSPVGPRKQPSSSSMTSTFSSSRNASATNAPFTLGRPLSSSSQPPTPILPSSTSPRRSKPVLLPPPKGSDVELADDEGTNGEEDGSGGYDDLLESYAGGSASESDKGKNRGSEDRWERAQAAEKKRLKEEKRKNMI